MSGLDLLIPQSALWYMLLVAVLVGVILGVFCDALFILRLFFRDPDAYASVGRRKKRHEEGTAEQVSDTSCGDGSRPSRKIRFRPYLVLRGFCDFVFAVAVSIVFLLLCYYTADGQVRAPAVFGISLGFFVYHKTVSRVIRKVFAVIVGWICRWTDALLSHTVGRLARAILHRLQEACAARRAAKKAKREKEEDVLQNDTQREVVL